MRSIAVVGASVAGITSARELRRRGFDGKLLLIGDEPELPYDRTPLSKSFLTGAKDETELALVNADELGELGIEPVFGTRAVRLLCSQRAIELADGRSQRVDGVVIATGSATRRLPLLPIGERIHELRTLADARRLRDRLAASSTVAIVGGGFIGIELAAQCRIMGLDVTVIEPLATPLESRLGQLVAEFLLSQHVSRGVRLHCGTIVTAVDVRGSGGIRLLLGNGVAVEADVVIVGVGVEPETAWLRSSGVELDHGVLTDGWAATNVPGVVAAGDVARYASARYRNRMCVAHWTNARDMPSVAAATLLAGSAVRSEIPPYDPAPYVWSDQYDLKIQLAGRIVDPKQLRVVDGSVDDGSFVATAMDGDEISGVVAVNRMREFGWWRRKTFMHPSARTAAATERNAAGSPPAAALAKERL